MRSLIILLFLTAVNGASIVEIVNLKNGVLIIHEVGPRNPVILDLQTPDGTFMSNILFTGYKSLINPELNILFSIDGKNETITLTRTLDSAYQLVDCFQFNDDRQWFGRPQRRYQHCPIQHMYYKEEPYLPTHSGNMAFAERYWLSSKGIYIYVSATSPLFIDQRNYGDKNLCLIAKNKAPYRNNTELTYTIGIFPDPKTAHEHAVKNHLERPTGLPDERMIQYPIWSTWARYKANVSEEVVEAFADEILANKFKNSQIEIDDNWETCYGSAKFNPDKFPDVKALVQRLKEKGFRVTLWIHPFINRDCECAYNFALENNYFVKNLDGNVKISWWQGADAATIDFTNSEAVKWWVERLKRLQKLGIDSFIFDAGEVDWLPQVPVLNASLELQPGIFTKEYTRILQENFDDKIVVRAGWRSQKLPIFVRMIDKDTRWTWNNGLPTLITTLLQMNLNGYVFVLPDIIGGKGYQNSSLDGTEYPSKEIFIRWLQVSVFMPALQYSFTPWDYDEETINICKKYTELHANYKDEILNAMKQAIEKGTPVNPPIWWIDPNNEEAHKINDEFLLGESILVAPVIEEGAVSRNIYLPAGDWKDMTIDTSFDVLHQGPIWLIDYTAPLEVLPYFRKV